MHEDRPQEASDIVSEVVLWALLGIVRICGDLQSVVVLAGERIIHACIVPDFRSDVKIFIGSLPPLGLRRFRSQ